MLKKLINTVSTLGVVLGLASCAKLEDSPFRALEQGELGVGSQLFSETLEQEALAQWHSGNKVKTLVNGGEYFPAMLEAVKQAKKSITFETFVAVDGFVTHDLVLALAERAQAGVKVHVVLDGIGSGRLDKGYLTALRNGGVEVEIYRKYNPLRPLYSNNRDHRKILVMDGKVGFTGGAGYADCWDGDARNVGEWRDTMYRLEGPVVADLQKGFTNNWKEVRGVELEGADYFPRLQKSYSSKSVKALATLGAPMEREETLGATNLLAIDAAKHSILIEHAYFLPNRQIKAALIRAAQRGVKVQVIAPNRHIDTKVVREVSKTHWPELMRAGVEIYEFQTSMMHGKLLVVDDALSIIGSGNFDNRSYFINDELNVVVLGRSFASEQRAMFERDLKRSKRMTRKDARVGLFQIPRRYVGKLLEPQL